MTVFVDALELAVDGFHACKDRVALGHEILLDEFVDQIGDRAAGQTGMLSQLRPCL